MTIDNETYRLGMTLAGIFIALVIIGLVVVFGFSKKSEGFQSGVSVPPINGVLNTDNISTIQSVLPVDQLDSMFSRIEEMKQEVRKRVSQTLPKGLICMWSGTVPPSGWALCDGNGTPDLSGKFILGANPDRNINVGVVNNPDGLNYHTDNINLTIKANNLPPHVHKITGFHKFDGNTLHYHFGYDDGVLRYGSFERATGRVRGGSNRTARKEPTKNDPTEENETNNFPLQIPKVPYYSLAYIMYLGIDNV